MKDFTLYPEALELKQLGFDEDCFYVKLISNPEFFYTPTDYDDYPKQKEKEVLIPTYSQAFRWFRENHNLHAWIINAEDNHNVFKPFFRGDNIYDQHLVDFYDSYEEAELACLKKLIEIVKGGKK